MTNDNPLRPRAIAGVQSNSNLLKRSTDTNPKLIRAQTEIIALQTNPEKARGSSPRVNVVDPAALATTGQRYH
jgi:hypothetical protein